jgi:hypothetical protein
MKKYTLRDGSAGDTIDKINEIAETGLGPNQIGNFVMKNAGNNYSANELVNTAKNYMDGSGIGKGTTKPPGTEAPATETTDLTKHAVPVAVGGATTLGIKYGLKKGWGMALAGGVVTGGIAHYLKNKQETV